MAGGDEVVPAGREHPVVAVQLVPAYTVAGDFHAVHQRFPGQADLDGGDGGFLHFGLYGGKGVGDEGGGVVQPVMVHIYVIVPDDFEIPPLFPVYGQEEGVAVRTVGERDDGGDFPRSLIPVPAVDFVHGVVGHQGQRPVFQSEDGAGFRLAQDGSPGDAAALREDVIGKDGEIPRDVGV